MLLDGATTVPRHADTGCEHGVAWYARTLGTALLAAATAEPRQPLAGALADAIAQVRDLHAGTCELTHPATPAATVTAVRAEPGGIGYLALSDSSVAADFGDGRPPLILTDRHPGARADPGAAADAATGTIPRRRPARRRPAQRRRHPPHRPVPGPVLARACRRGQGSRPR